MYAEVSVMVESLAPLCVYSFTGFKRNCPSYCVYIVVVSFSGGGKRSIRKKPPTAASHWQTLSHNVVSWS